MAEIFMHLKLYFNIYYEICVQNKLMTNLVVL